MACPTRCGVSTDPLGRRRSCRGYVYDRWINEGEDVAVLFVGDDWAEEHHDVEIQDAAGRRLVKTRVPEGLAGVARLHELITGCLDDTDSEDANGDAPEVPVGIETERGPWVQALVAAGYRVFRSTRGRSLAIGSGIPTRARRATPGDAHALADMVRTDGHQLRPIAGDSEQAAGLKVRTRAHQGLTGTAPAWFCGCGSRCGSTSRPHSRPGACAAGPRRPRRPGCPDHRHSMSHADMGGRASRRIRPSGHPWCRRAAGRGRVRGVLASGFG